MVECMAANKEALCGKCTRQHGDVPLYPNMLFNGLSKILNISYSTFCAATWALIRYFPYVPFRATISPHAPPTFELISKAFQRR